MKESVMKLVKCAMLRLFRNVDTVIPCLLSTYKFYDRIAIAYHDGSNDDGSVDAVKYAISKFNLNESCNIELFYYPFRVYFTGYPYYGTRREEKRYNCQNFGMFTQFAFNATLKGVDRKCAIYAKIDADQIYIPGRLEERYDILMKHMEEDPSRAYKINGYNWFTTPFEDGKIYMNGCGISCGYDHCLYSPDLCNIGYDVNNWFGQSFVEEPPDRREIVHLDHHRVSSFEYKLIIPKKGFPEKVKPLIDDLRPVTTDPSYEKIKEDFQLIQPIIERADSPFRGYKLS